MKRVKTFVIACAMGLSMGLFISNTSHAECGDITISEMNWASAQLMANVDKIILQEGYCCKAEMIPGVTMPTFTSLNEKVISDEATDCWVNAVREPF